MVSLRYSFVPWLCTCNLCGCSRLQSLYFGICTAQMSLFFWHVYPRQPKLGGQLSASFLHLHIWWLLKRNWIKSRRTQRGRRSEKDKKKHKTLPLQSQVTTLHRWCLEGVGVSHVPWIQTVVCWRKLETCVDSLSIYSPLWQLVLFNIHSHSSIPAPP